MRFLAVFACAVALAVPNSLPAQAKVAPQAASSERSVLPSAFAGWVTDEAPKTISDPAQIDAANAAALKEYGIISATTATYKRDGETLTLKAMTFPDVSGAYGAFSFYRSPDWAREEIGTGAASNKNRVIFWRGTVVVDATFSTVRPESASELRELADSLPAATGNKALLPPILDLLPKSGREDQASRYAKSPTGLVLLPGKGLEVLSPRYSVGPAGYAAGGGVLPAGMVGFDRDAEAVTASYSLASGPATLTLISYPTPQMATAAEAQIRAYIQSGGKGQTPFTKPLQDSDQASLEVRHTGPIVAIVSGDAIPDESHKLIETVHYSSDLNRIPMPGVSDVAKTSSLLLNIAMFVLIVGGTAVFLGFTLGGGRALYRLARGKPISSVFEAEFTRLNLRD
ncbi:MAG TPA: DUF6599 family protein [Terracidiphilus sp.]|jgi:hypothetical protein